MVWLIPALSGQLHYPIINLMPRKNPYQSWWYGTYMAQVWKKYGMNYGPYMVFLWPWYGLLPSISNPYLVTVSSQVTFYCLVLWVCYVFRKVPYILHMICVGTAWDYPIAKPYDPILCIWDFYVFRKVP